MYEYCKNCVRTPMSSRREFLSRLGMGFSALGLATLLREDSPLRRRHQHRPVAPFGQNSAPFRPRPSGSSTFLRPAAPSQVDTWDPKPVLAQARRTTHRRTRRGDAPRPSSSLVMAAPASKSAMSFPRKLAEHVDEMAIIRSMLTDIPAHELATVMMNTGSRSIPKPSVGSWALYGLGTENQNMPGFISLHNGGGLPAGGTQNWSSAFLPGIYQRPPTSIPPRGGSGQDDRKHPQPPLRLRVQNSAANWTAVHQLNELHAQDLQKMLNWRRLFGL